MRIGLVLSAGGLRGAAHLGVLRRLVELGLRIDVLAGVSAGAVIAGYYAGVGLTVDEMIGDAPSFRGRHLLVYGLARRLPPRLRPMVEWMCGPIPRRVRQLEGIRFDELHHRVGAVGIVCHDQVRGRPWYFSTLRDHGVALADAVRASAAVPGVFRPRTCMVAGEIVQLVDGGLSDALPVEFARSTLGATHLVVSDCRRLGRSRCDTENLIYVRPSLDQSFRDGRADLQMAVTAGEAAVTAPVADRIRQWAGDRDRQPDAEVHA